MKYTLVIEVDTGTDPAELDDVEATVVDNVADTWYVYGGADRSRDCKWSCRIVRPIDAVTDPPQSSAP